MNTSSTKPTPPGVIGNAESRRTRANTPSTCVHVSSAPLIPTERNAISSTRYKATWLARVVSVRGRHRASTRSMVWVRKREHDAPQSDDRDFRVSAHQAPWTPPNTRLTLLAASSFHSISASTPTAAPNALSPTVEATSIPPLARPATARATNAMIGSPSLAKTFHMNVTTVDRAISASLKPQERYIE